jgi:alkanesulfonate monooxygenase SsuD/methylene tetrahydromethanopterin reductase-like flavin-dependent oxidoreductase (luciferase family)
VSLPLPLSILDLATVGDGETIRDGLEASVALAQRAERHGFRRIWYAEHHNMRAVASSATSVLIAHVAAHTERITLGSGGVMLPNHSPLVIAALRRDPTAADRFPQDVQELQAFLSDESRIPGVYAYPGRGTAVPLTILGSSLYGARVAAALGLPYAFASHFAPDALEQAVALYRAEFRPSAQLAAPHVLAAVNVVAADSADEAAQRLHAVQRDRVKRFLSRGGHELTDEEAEMLLDAPAGSQIRSMTRYTAAGTPDVVVRYLEDFARRADADELIVTFPVVDRAEWFRSFELLAEQVRLAAV